MTAFDNVGVWASRNMLNQFRSRGIEKAYRRYVALLWLSNFLWWLVVCASCLSIAPVLDVLRMTPLLPNGSEAAYVPHATFRHVLYASSGIFWALAALLAMALRDPSHVWRERVASHQQSILASIVVTFTVAATLPVLMASQAEVAAGHAGSSIVYLDGRWHVLVASSGAVLVACSGLSPPLFALLELTAFALWEARNHALRRAVGWEGELAAAGATTNASSLNEHASGHADREGHAAVAQTVIVEILHYVPIALICFIVSYQRDRLMRQNFVILQLVKSRQDHTISALRGEKAQLELMLAVDRAQSEASAHIKIMSNFSPRPPKPARAARRWSREGHNVNHQGHAAKHLVTPCPRHPAPPAKAARVAPPAAGRPTACRAATMTTSSTLSTDTGCEPRAGVPPPGDSTALLRKKARETRLLAASDHAEAARDEIGQLTQALDEEACVSASALSSGRSVDWRAREHSPLHGHQSALPLVRPSPMRGTPAPTPPTLPKFDGHSEACTIPRAEAEASVQKLVASPKSSPMDSFASLGFRMPTTHQEAVSSQAAESDGMMSA